MTKLTGRIHRHRRWFDKQVLRLFRNVIRRFVREHVANLPVEIPGTPLDRHDYILAQFFDDLNNLDTRIEYHGLDEVRFENDFTIRPGEVPDMPGGFTPCGICARARHARNELHINSAWPPGPHSCSECIDGWHDGSNTPAFRRNTPPDDDDNTTSSTDIPRPG